MSAHSLSHVRLCDTMNCSQTGSSSMGFSRPEYWSGLPCPLPQNLPTQGLTPTSCFPCIGRQILNQCATWEVPILYLELVKHYQEPMEPVIAMEPAHFMSPRLLIEKEYLTNTKYIVVRYSFSGK